MIMAIALDLISVPAWVAIGVWTVLRDALVDTVFAMMVRTTQLL